MDDSGAAFAESTSKICWFSLSSLLFKSSSQPEEKPQQPTLQENRNQNHSQPQQTTPNSSPVRRRTSPRLSNKPKSPSKGSSPAHYLLNKNDFCLLKDSSPTESKCSVISSSAIKKETSNNGHVTANNTSINNSDQATKKQRQPQYSVKAGLSEDSGSSPLSSLGNGLNEHACCQGHRHHQSEEEADEEYAKTHGLTLKEAPHYLTFNPYITGGYRNSLEPVQCIKSLFWWTNETLNIWSHLLGWVFFFSLSVYDVMGLSNLPKTQPWDQAISFLLLVCFQACMILSAAYHVFCCCSERSYRQWLSMDLLGVSLSLLAIYISGIYYAFSCVPSWLNFYLSTVGAIFVCCLTCTFLRTSDGFSNRLLLFGGWACYGIVPTVHWAILHGGFKSQAVALLLPRIFGMYVISAAAFFFYVTRLPERWKPGLVNYIGSSHQIWHVLIVAALYHWHNTGLIYLDYRAQHPCSEEYAALYPTASE